MRGLFQVEEARRDSSAIEAMFYVSVDGIPIGDIACTAQTPGSIKRGRVFARACFAQVNEVIPLDTMFLFCSILSVGRWSGAVEATTDDRSLRGGGSKRRRHKREQL